MDINSRKRDLRQTMTAKLKAVSRARKLEAGRVVSAHVQSWLKNFEHLPKLSVGLYKSFSDEISTEDLDAMLRLHGARRAVAYPSNETFDVPYYALFEGEELANINAKKNLDQAQSLDFDIIFVPGLAFDSSGRRLGRGRGAFDRTLSSCASWPKSPVLVGLLLDEQLVPLVPVAGHDIVLDYLCTPSHGMIKIPARDSHA